MKSKGNFDRKSTVTRRNFFKIGAIGTALSIAGASRAAENAITDTLDKATDDAVLKELDEDPFDFKGGYEYKRFDEINTFQSTGPMRRDEKVIPKMIKLSGPVSIMTR